MYTSRRLFSQRNIRWALMFSGFSSSVALAFKYKQLSLETTKNDIDPSTSFKPLSISTPKQHDFQEKKPAMSSIFERLKPKDGETAIHLIQKYQTKEIKSVLDVGCGQGDMLPYLAQLGKNITIHLNDTVAERVEEYAINIAQTPNTCVGEKIVGSMEKVEFPKVDLILASHSLYYNVSSWKTPKQVFLKKLLDTLNTEGLLCVILLANEPTGIPAINAKRQYIANLEEFEDAIYPLIQKASNNPGQRSYANARMFLNALHHYKQHFEPTLDYEVSAPIIVPIQLGDLNFEPDINGFYPQSKVVTDYLNFYTRGCYDDPKKERQMTGEQQKQVLDFIQNNCHAKEGYVITHVNQAILVRYQISDQKQKKLHATQPHSTKSPV